MADDRLVRFSSYRLPTAEDWALVQLAPGESLSNSGFPGTVRRFHLDRLPQFTGAITGVVCAYCGTLHPSLACEVDHIIPIAIYCKYHLMALYEQKQRMVPPQEINALDRDLFAADLTNLILACKACNQAKRMVMPNIPFVHFPDAVLSAHQAMDRVFQSASIDDVARGRLLQKVQTNREHLNNIDRMSRTRASGNRGLYVLGHYGVPGRSSARLADAAGAAAAAAAPAPDPVDVQISAVQFIVAGIKRPPNVTHIRALLAMDQAYVDKTAAAGAAAGAGAGAAGAAAAAAAATPTDEPLRVCHYCLGLYRDQFFELDHIQPRQKGVHDERVYNDPTNIIPVCSTCNGSKAERALTSDWLDERTAARIQHGILGMNDVLTARQFAKADNVRRRLLGLPER